MATPKRAGRGLGSSTVFTQQSHEAHQAAKNSSRASSLDLARLTSDLGTPTEKRMRTEEKTAEMVIAKQFWRAYWLGFILASSARNTPFQRLLLIAGDIEISALVTAIARSSRRWEHR